MLPSAPAIHPPRDTQPPASPRSASSTSTDDLLIAQVENEADAPIDRGGYDFNAMQAKWRPVWEKLDPFKARDDGSAERRYALTMFSYPSGDLHMGHGEV